MDFPLPSPTNSTRLRWRARRGLLENDLIITRFLDQHEETLSETEVLALARLLDLGDNELMDYLLARKPLDSELADDLEVVRILERLQNC